MLPGGQVMRDPAAIADEENWHGGFYELSVGFDPPPPPGLDEALATLWRTAGIEGCQGARDVREEVPCTVDSLREFGHLRGVVTLPSGHRVVCACFLFHYEDEPEWLYF